MVQERLTDIIGHLIYFSILFLLSLAAVAACVYKTIKPDDPKYTPGRPHSRFVLPAAWAIYNAIGPMLFFASAMAKKTRSLGMAALILFYVSGDGSSAVAFGRGRGGMGERLSIRSFWFRRIGGGPSAVGGGSGTLTLGMAGLILMYMRGNEPKKGFV